MLRKAVYPKVESLLNFGAGFCREKGITPNQLTLAGLALNFLAGWLFSDGHFFLGGPGYFPQFFAKPGNRINDQWKYPENN